MLPCGYWSCHCPVLWYKLYWKYYHPRGVDLSIPNYVSNTLHEFQRPYSKEYAPHKWERPNYVVKAQWSKEESLLEILPKPRRKNPQNWGDFPYYFWAVNPTLLVALESIGVEKSKGTTQLEAAVQKTFRLLCNPSKFKTMISHHRHDTENTQQHTLLIITQDPHHSSRVLINGLPNSKNTRKKT